MVAIKTHAVIKTDIDLRRSIHRLENFATAYPYDDLVKDGTVAEIVEAMKCAKRKIPKHMQDLD